MSAAPKPTRLPAQNDSPTMPLASQVEDPELLRDRAMGPPNAPGMLGVIGNYPVLRVIGAGGMGIVLAARDPVSERPVAIKLLKPELRDNPRMVHRFLVEARHMRQMAHPNIVPVFDVSDDTQRPHYVMPLFDRGSLASKIDPDKGVDPAISLPAMRQVAEALAYAHGRGLIHRDLKPANILIHNDGTACVCDFGLVRTVFNDTIVDARQSNREGSAPYMSPAVAKGDAEDTRCDIYSFGATLYELLAGTPPYEGHDAGHVIQKVLAGPPAPIRKLKPSAHPALTAVAEGAMARELRDRYASMEDVAEDLRRIERGETPIGPHGQRSSARPAWKTTALLLTPFIIIVGAIWLWPRDSANSPRSVAPVAGSPAEGYRGKPYRRSPAEIARIEAENFDDGGQRISFFDRTADNYGGAYRDTDVDIYTNEPPGVTCVGQTEPGEWLGYTVDIPTAGRWDFVAQAATQHQGIELHIECDGTDVSGPLALTATGDWQTYEHFRFHLRQPLTAGRHVMKICFDSAGDGQHSGNYDWIGFVPADPTPATKP